MKLLIIPIQPQSQSLQAHQTKRESNHLNLQKRTPMEIIRVKETTLVAGRRRKFKRMAVVVSENLSKVQRATFFKQLNSAKYLGV
jgi:hypothetical protein